MSRSSNARRGHRGKGELWSRRAGAAKLHGHYNGADVKKVTNHKERRKAHVEVTTMRRGHVEDE